MKNNIECDHNLLNYLIRGVKDYAIFALDPDGIIITWNIGAERAKGYTAEEIIGKHFSTFYTEEAKASKHPEFELVEALKNGSYEEEGWRVRKDGSLFWAQVTITALYDDDGRHIGFAKVTRDLSERKTLEAESLHQKKQLQESENAFREIVNVVKDYAIFMLSPDGIIKTWNSGAERIKGYKAREIIGKHFSIFYPEAVKKSKHLEFELQEAVSNGSYEEEGWRIRKDGSQFWASVTITSVMEDGKLSGFIKVSRDLTEKKLLETQLEEARDQAILANQLKSKFVANVTHEIRTPLSGIIGLSQLIAENDDIPGDVQDSGKRIFEASGNLLGLLNDLLDFAKLEAGKIDLDEKPYAIAQLFDEVKGLTETKAKSKSLKIRTTIDEALPTVIILDATKVRQILLNLVHNSIKFTEAGGIEIAADKIDDSIVFSVTDTGIGVSEDVQSKLFAPFTQGHDATFGGTGLGLSICRQFVELMGGKIDMVSELGRGTSVSFSLPMKEEAGDNE